MFFRPHFLKNRRFSTESLITTHQSPVLVCARCGASRLPEVAAALDGETTGFQGQEKCYGPFLVSETDRRETEVKRYSPRTRRNYLQHIREFLSYTKAPPGSFSFREMDLFLLHLVEDKGVAESTQNVAISAIKFFYHYVLHKDVSLRHLHRPKRRSALSAVERRMNNGPSDSSY